MLEPLEKNSLNASHAYHNAYHDNAESNSDVVKDPYDAMWNDSSSDESGIFGLPFTVDESSLVIVPVPCDVACSQAMGTANAPDLILRESRYVELHDVVLGNIYERRLAMKPVATELSALLARMSEIDADQPGSSLNLDPLCSEMNTVIENIVDCELKTGRATGLLGGDHSVSYGSIAAHRRAFPNLGILQIDAHADLRPSLDGMVWSHASVMYHIMENLEPVSLTQVGVRAICSVEHAYQESNERITSYTDHELQMQLAAGKSWLSVCDQIVASLPNEIYLSLDIDGLDPVCCPRTGTPVPGGLSFIQVTQLLHRIVESGRIIRGFDLVEVGADQYDALVAAHLLYLLCGLVENRQISS